MYLINKKFWNKKKVFVTGHTGFKGSWLCIILNHLGAEVTGYSLSPSTSPNLFNLANVGKIIKKSVIADVRNYNKLLHEIKKSKSTIIFHLAAQPLVRHSYEEPKKTFDTNFALSILALSLPISVLLILGILTAGETFSETKNIFILCGILFFIGILYPFYLQINKKVSRNKNEIQFSADK